MFGWNCIHWLLLRGVWLASHLDGAGCLVLAFTNVTIINRCRHKPVLWRRARLPLQASKTPRPPGQTCLQKAGQSRTSWGARLPICAMAAEYRKDEVRSSICWRLGLAWATWLPRNNDRGVRSHGSLAGKSCQPVHRAMRSGPWCRGALATAEARRSLPLEKTSASGSATVYWPPRQRPYSPGAGKGNIACAVCKGYGPSRLPYQLAYL